MDREGDLRHIVPAATAQSAMLKMILYLHRRRLGTL